VTRCFVINGFIWPWTFIYRQKRLYSQKINWCLFSNICCGLNCAGEIFSPKLIFCLHASGATLIKMWSVLLFYVYTPIADVEAHCSWQDELTKRLGLVGRILVAAEGLNGTVAGLKDAMNIEQYIEAMKKKDPRFASIDWKTSPSLVRPFPDMRSRVVDEIVGHGRHLLVADVQNTGCHLTPQAFHQALLEAREGGSASIVLLDVRNALEHEVGRFEGAISPDMRVTSEFGPWCDQHVDLLRGKQVLMYCTGGVRCEKASAYVRTLPGCENVSQLQGGIHRYLEAFPDGGLFKGQNFVFDARLTVPPPNFDPAYQPAAGAANLPTVGLEVGAAAALPTEAVGFRDGRLSPSAVNGVPRADDGEADNGADPVDHGSGDNVDGEEGVSDGIANDGDDGGGVGGDVGGDDGRCGSGGSDGPSRDSGAKRLRLEVVGTCACCGAAWDTLSPATVCAVCMSLCLACPTCRATRPEVCCPGHRPLLDHYRWFLDPYSAAELAGQRQGLEVSIARWERGCSKRWVGGL
jgi:predicted sulfurtransferase